MIAVCSCFCGPGGGGVLMVPVGAIGPFWPGDGLFRALCVCLCVCVCVCELGGCVQS